MKRFSIFIVLVALMLGLPRILLATSSLGYNSQSMLVTAPDGVAYQWFINGTHLVGVTSQQIMATQPGTYTLVMAQPDGTNRVLSIVIGSQASKPTVYVIGDSTASLYDSSTYPRTGWAQVLQPFFNKDSVEVNDQAASGRSSKSFDAEGRWTKVYNMLNPGDYVFIQFAHNDEKTDDPTRYTEPSTTYKMYLTKFVDSTREKGAYPVLLSSIPRNNWSGTVMSNSHGPYTKAMREVAAALNVPFIDMEAITMAYLNGKGKAYTTDNIYLNLPAATYPAYPSGNADNTHLQENGAFEICKLVVAGLNGTTTYPEMERLVKCSISVSRISAMPSPALKGTISGTGVFASNSSITLNATPAAGYRFVKWSLKTDTIALSCNASYSFTSDTINLSFVAYFESVTGDHRMADVPNVQIYPNPASRRFQVKVSDADCDVEIIDLNGKLIWKQKNADPIDFSQLKRGLCLVRVMQGNKLLLSELILLQ